MRYSKSIIVYGLIIPGVILGIIAAALLIGFGTFSSKATAKKLRWEDHKQRLVKIAALEAKIAPMRDAVIYGKDLLNRDIQSAFSQFLDQALSGSGGNKVVRQSLDFPPTISMDQTLGASYRKVDLGVIGRYDGMQALALDAETKFPQLCLDTYTIQRFQPTQNVPTPHLSFKVTFKSYTDGQ